MLKAALRGSDRALLVPGSVAVVLCPGLSPLLLVCVFMVQLACEPLILACPEFKNHGTELHAKLD